MYCSNCGNRLEEGAMVCDRCSRPVHTHKKRWDWTALAFGAVGFFVPLLGAVLFLVCRLERLGLYRPRWGDAAGKGAILGVIVRGVVYVLLIVVVTVWQWQLLSSIPELPELPTLTPPTLS